MVNIFRGGNFMRFAVIMEACGFSVTDYPRASLIPVTLYDRKDRVVTDENIRFVEPLFAYNSRAKREFEMFIKDLEEMPISSFNVRIDENLVAVLYKSPNNRVFSRLIYNDPLEYMD